MKDSFQGFIIVVVCFSFIYRMYHNWKHRKFMDEILAVLQSEKQRCFTQENIEYLFKQTAVIFQVKKKYRMCYRSIVKELIVAYEIRSQTLNAQERYEELSHLYQLLQIGIDNQYLQRNFATLFLKTKAKNEYVS